jgi:hypothetical protein
MCRHMRYKRLTSSTSYISIPAVGIRKSKSDVSIVKWNTVKSERCSPYT